MTQTVEIVDSPEDRERLIAVVGDHNRPQKHFQPAQIIR
jgi:hypothetical protein